MRNYYELVASLPHLPRFDQAESLPISRERLLNRLKMLEPEDYKIADKAAELIAWRRQTTGRTDAEIVEIYKDGMKLFSSPVLKELLGLPINQRTILSALRRKEMGLPKPASKELWGMGDLVGHIERNWDAPYFKLAAVYPWIVQAKADLQSNDSLHLEYLLKNLIWDKLGRLLFKNSFGFEVVIAYLMKWDIIQQWLSFKKEGATSRFEEEIKDIVDKYEQRFSSSL